MPPELQEQQVDLTTDIVENDGNIGEGGIGDQPVNENASVRELLEQAANVKVDEAGRAHGPDGKFVTKPEEQAPTGQEQQVTGQEQQVPTGQEPVSLIPEYQAIISSLPEEHRAAVQAGMAARETAVANYVQQLTARVTGYDAIEKVIGPRRQAWAMGGTTPEAAVNQLFALSDFATNDPQGFIEWFAGNNGIDLSAIGETFVPPDPQYTALTNQIAQLTGMVNNLTNGANNAQQQQFVTAVQQFEGAVDATGQRLHPHFQAVSNDMLALIPAIRQQFPAYSAQEILNTAYDRAVYANPTTRQAILAANAAKDAAERAKAATAAARAGQSLSGGTPNGDVQPNAVQQADSVRGALEAAFAMHS